VKVALMLVAIDVLGGIGSVRQTC